MSIADNQFQALQNQATEVFSVCGTMLQKLEADVAQIQLIVRLSLRHLLLVDQQDLVHVQYQNWRILVM
jgi:hypothetical protein